MQTNVCATRLGGIWNGLAKLGTSRATGQCHLMGARCRGLFWKIGMRGVSKMKRWIYILGLWFLCLQAGYSAESQEQRWLNLPDSPLKFALLANEYTLSLTNVSNKEIQKLTLGCADRVSGNLTRKLRNVTISLDPGESSAGNLDSYLNDFAACKVSHSSLAVIRVTFAGGASWKYKPKSGSKDSTKHICPANKQN